jgi:hypothetical protein
MYLFKKNAKQNSPSGRENLNVDVESSHFKKWTFGRSSSLGDSSLVQLLLRHGGVKHRDIYNELNEYLSLPDGLKNINVKVNTILSTGVEVTISWCKDSPSYNPTSSEAILDSEQVTEQFKKDLCRSQYIIEFPGVEGNVIEIDRRLPEDTIINDILIGVFGAGYLRQISEIAHQAHMAEFAIESLNMWKGEYIVVQGGGYPRFILSKQENGCCIITSLQEFKIRHQDSEKYVDGLILEFSRTNVLRPDPKDRTKLLSGTMEEKDGMIFSIKYVKSQSPRS